MRQRTAQERRSRRRIDKTFTLEGTVTSYYEGTSSSGNDYCILRVSGFTFFPDQEFWNEYEEGERLRVTGEFTGERYDKRSQGTVPTFEIYDIEVIPSVPTVHGDVESVTLHNGNGNGHNGETIPRLDKGAPSKVA